MESALGWIGSLFETIISLLPHLGLCKVTHGGLKFKRAGKVSEIRPGLYWYWPVVTEIALIPVVRQTLNLPTQILTTRDSQSIIVSGVVVYVIRNVRQALADSWDHDDTIEDLALATLSRYVLGHTFDEIISAQTDGSIEEALTKTCRDDLTSFGVTARKFFVSDLARTKVLAISGGGSGMVVAGEEEDE